MIKITKLEKPAILEKKEEIWTKKILDAQTNGNKVSDYLIRRYTHPEIKEQLLKETHGKCAYCESKLTHISYGHIEHIKPKAKFPQGTFAWENLTLACEICNINKGDYYSEEYPLLNPYKDEVEQIITFLGEIAFSRTTSDKWTVEKLNLNRTSLIEKRRDKLKVFTDLIIQFLELTEDNPLKAVYRMEIEEHIKNEAEYSSVLKYAAATML